MLIRALLQLVLVPAATLFLGLPAICFCPLDRSGRLFPWLARRWSGVLFLAAGVRVTLEGGEHLVPDRPVVLVANHLSLLDPPALVAALPLAFHFIAKRSLFRVPVFGLAIRAAGVIPIDRGDRDRAVASMDRAAQRVRRGASVLVFAEGTRSRDGRLQPLKKGAFILSIQAGVPTQPVVITGSRALLPPGSWLTRPGTVHIRVLPTVDTTGLSFENRDELRERVTRRLAEALDEPPPLYNADGPPAGAG